MTMGDMPSPRHDALVQMFQDRPELAVEILRDLLAVELPETPLIRLENPTFNTRNSDDIEADSVVVLGPPHAPLLAIAVEIQLDKTKDPVQLARYAAALWLMLKCDVIVLVICPDDGIAAHYGKPIRTGMAGCLFRCQVVGPSVVPPITSPQLMVENPEWAEISLMMHWRNREVLDAFTAGLAMMTPEAGYKAYETAYSLSGPETRRLLEEFMAAREVPIVSPFGREYYGRGKEEGRAEGVVAEAARILTLVLSARGLTATPDVAHRIATCRDPRQLEQWTTRAIVADTVDEVFAVDTDLK